jgi:Protein of unknown function (DUF1778)
MTDKNDTKRGIEATAASGEAQIIRLSAKDQRAFAEAILNPPEPTAALLRAARRHRELIQEFEPRGVRSPVRDVEL